jgi:tyrosine-protein kinase Etk/Wzc
MFQSQNINSREGNELQKKLELILKNYKLFIVFLLIALSLAYVFNRYSIPVYKISASVLIKEETSQHGGNINDFLSTNIFGIIQKFQNELWVLKSSPVIQQAIRNLNLMVNYYQKEGHQYIDAYENVPFRILYAHNHVQPINVRFNVTLQQGGNFIIKAESKKVSFYNFDKNETAYQKNNWSFQRHGKSGELIETPELSFILEWDHNKKVNIIDASSYYFEFKSIHYLTEVLKKKLQFNLVDKQATVIEISIESESIMKGRDLINGLMDVYSKQNLERKNHIANITIDYIEKQLDEISNSLSKAEDNLQSFRSTHQLLNVTEQASGISTQYMDLQNQMAELITRKRYYDYVSDYLSKNEDFSNMIVPASMGITDQLLNNLMSELITAQTQRSNLIQNQQGKNPLVQRLGIQIENLKKAISENINAVQKTTDISIEEMNKRIRKVEGQISRLPKTQRKLGGIERTYRLNDAIYNYLLEKRAEAKITQASNLPDNIIIEPAKMDGTGPISPNKRMNYIAALVLGLAIPFGFLVIKKAVNKKIDSEENIEQLLDVPILGKILHNKRNTDNLMFEHPRTRIAESYRTLRTNLDYHFRKIPQKIIMVTSCIEGEGKSFTALNLAMGYAQLGRRTILVDFDLRKQNDFFSKQEESLVGVSSYFTERVGLEDIILPSPHQKLDYIPSGPVPPNPIELLATERTKELFEQLKDAYDCIVLDTSPLAQVSDAYFLMDHANLKLIIARYNYTIKKVFSLIIKDLKKKNIDNVCVMMNDNRDNSDQYGYGYGYKKKRQ